MGLIALFAGSPALAKPSVGAKVDAVGTGSRWSAVLRNDSHPADGRSFDTLTITPEGKTPRVYGFAYGGPMTAEDFARPPLTVVNVPGIDEPLLQVRVVSEGDVPGAFLLSTVLARVSADGALTTVFATDVMMLEGGSCKRKQSLELAPVDKGVRLTKRDAARAQPPAKDCPAPVEHEMARTYDWNGRCFARHPSERDFNVDRDAECTPAASGSVRSVFVPIAR